MSAPGSMWHLVPDRCIAVTVRILMASHNQGSRIDYNSAPILNVNWGDFLW